MSLLSKLTLVMLTYRRPRYAIRNMRYWSKRDAVLHVLDGSDEAIAADELRDLGPNIHYHHLPVSLFDRLGAGSKLISTSYAALLGDDELYLPDGLEACIRELDADVSLVSCMGRSLGFRPIPSEILGYPAYTEMAGYAVLQDDPIDRLIYH